VKRVAIVGPIEPGLEEMLRAAGFEPETLPGSGFAPEDLADFDLCLIAAFCEEGLPLYDRFRESLGSRRVSVVLVLNPGQGDLPESFFAGINDVLVWPGPAGRARSVVERQFSVARRREASTIARVRRMAADDSGAFLGSAVNVSRTGLLLEVRKPLDVGDSVEVEFFLGNAPEPVRALARVRRSAVDPSRLSSSYGVEFTRVSDTDRERLARFCESRE
jgi:hypothetical protein